MKAVADLAMLTDGVEVDDIVEVLKQRYFRDEIYTNVGEDVVALNPYRELSQLYTEKVRASYQNDDDAIIVEKPHVYALIQKAWTGLKRDHGDHCIVITGESGAGKTESAKIILDYLASMRSTSSIMKTVQKQLLCTNPVLEAFGNARAQSNSNSSRFGMFIEIYVDTSIAGNTQVKGAKASQFLLEKTRVASPPGSESNFHIFYQMMAGLTREQRSDFRLEEHDADFFRYLPKQEKMSQNQNAAAFQRTMSGLTEGGIQQSDINDVLKSLAGILWLGQISFEKSVHPETGETGSKVTSNHPLYMASATLGITSDVLEQALTSREMSARGESLRSCLTQAEAESARDSLSKQIYEQLFEWLVRALNSSMSVSKLNPPDRPESSMKRLCLLDVFGFEDVPIDESSTLSQLLINYFNEKLHELAVSHKICDELSEYINEGIAFAPIPISDSTSAVELIERSPHPSVFSLLDQASLLNEPVENLSKSLNEQLADHSHFVAAENAFVIKHYAADVRYSLNNFIEHNRELFFHGQREMMAQSSTPLLRESFKNHMNSSEDAPHRRPPSCTSLFKQGVRTLLRELSSQRLHYIRCLRPSDMKNELQAGFDDEYVHHQVTYLNLTEHIALRQAGYAFRSTLVTFLTRYGILSASPITCRASAVAEIVTRVCPGAMFDVGFSKVFIKDGETIDSLETARTSALHFSATVLQKSFRGHLGRSLRNERLKAVVTIQKAVMCRRRMKAARVILRAWRAHRRRRNRNAVKFLQRRIRARTSRRRHAVRVISEWWNDVSKARYLRMVVLIQKRFRSTRRARWYASLRRTAGETMGMSARLNESRLRFVGDYLPLETQSEAFQALMNQLGERDEGRPESAELFYDVAYKMNRFMRRYERRLLVTQSAVYVLSYHPRMTSFTVHNRMAFSSILEICLSGMADNIVVLKLTDGGMLCFDIPRKAEFCSFVRIMTNMARKRTLPIVLSNSIDNGGGRHRELSVSEAEDELSEGHQPRNIKARTVPWTIPACPQKNSWGRRAYKLKFVQDAKVTPGTCVIRKRGWRKATVLVGAFPHTPEDERHFRDAAY